MGKDNKQIAEILENAKTDSVWIKKLDSIASKEDLRSVLQEKGITLNDEVMMMMSGHNKEIRDDELELVSGGLDWEDIERFREFLSGCKIQL